MKRPNCAEVVMLCGDVISDIERKSSWMQSGVEFSVGNTYWGQAASAGTMDMLDVRIRKKDLLQGAGA